MGSFFYFVFLTVPVQAELTLESVYPNQGVMGQDIYVELKGGGFNVDTRVSMTLDTGNKKAILGSVDTPGSAGGVTVVDRIAYVTAGIFGLQVIDMSDLSSPSILGSVDTPGNARGVTIVGSTAYVADEGGGLTIIPVPQEIEQKDLINSTSINLALPSPLMAGNYTIRVFNNDGDWAELLA